MRYLRLLIHDFVEIYVIAFLGAVLPAELGAKIIWTGTRLYRFHPNAKAPQAAIVECWPDSEINVRQLRWNYLFEASTAWRMILGRKLTVSLVGKWPQAPGFIAAGGHYGSGITVLWSLREAGLKPRFLLRPPERNLLWLRPPLWLWTHLRFRLIKRLCPDGVVTTGGSLKTLESIVEQGQTTAVILFDTPAPPDHSDWKLQLGERAISLHTGAARMVDRKMHQRDLKIISFLAETQPRKAVIELHIQKLNNGDWQKEFVAKTSQAIETAPALWLMWPFVEPHLESRLND